MKSLTPGLGVDDIAASVRFYTDVLGFETRFAMPGDDGTLVHASIGRGNADIMFGVRSKTDTHDQKPLGRGVTLYTTVGDDEDIDALFAHAKAAGAPIVQEPKDQFWGHRDWAVTDPDGYLVYVSKEIRSVTPEEMQAALAGSPAD